MLCSANQLLPWIKWRRPNYGAKIASMQLKKDNIQFTNLLVGLRFSLVVCSSCVSACWKMLEENIPLLMGCLYVVMDSLFEEPIHLPTNDAVLIALLSTIYRRSHRPRVTLFAEHTVPLFTLEDFRTRFRMSRGTFERLTIYLGNFPVIPTVHTRGKPPVEVGKQVMIAVWYLATQESFFSIADRFDISESTCHGVVHRVCSALCQAVDVLCPWPRGQRIYEVSQGFQDLCGLPGIIGAVDGCHIRIRPLKDDEQSYYNRKKFHSIVLQGICDSSMFFTNVYCGWGGSTHDARVFRNSELCHRATFDQGSLFPAHSFLVADSAYPARSFLATALKNADHLNPVQRRYNVVVSRARVVIENAYALLKGRWRRLKYVEADVHLIPIIIVACCTLHNICLLEEEEFEEFIDAPVGLNDDEELHQDVDPPHPGGAELQAYIINLVQQLHL